MTMYYRVIEVWCKYPFSDVIDERYCIFSLSKRKFKAIDNLRIDSNTSIAEKEKYIFEQTGLRYKIEKVK
jgi:hypothetical protein